MLVPHSKINEGSNRQTVADISINSWRGNGWTPTRGTRVWATNAEVAQPSISNSLQPALREGLSVLRNGLRDDVWPAADPRSAFSRERIPMGQRLECGGSPQVVEALLNLWSHISVRPCRRETRALQPETEESFWQSRTLASTSNRREGSWFT